MPLDYKNNCFLECNCNEEGTTNGDVCDKTNGQCQCKKYQWDGVRCQIPISKWQLSSNPESLIAEGSGNGTWGWVFHGN